VIIVCNTIRIKRSVQAKFNTEISYISAQLMAGKEEDKLAQTAPDEDADIDDDAPRVAGFVRAKETEVKPTVPAEENLDNPDEIAIGDDDSDDSEEDDAPMTKRVIPDGVFGSLKA
jgi:pre-mRNA-splicing factor SYF1